MAKAIINKHIDNKDNLKRELFVTDIEKAKGEIVICNDIEEPSIYIVDNDNNVVKISGNGGGNGESGSYDDTKIWTQVNQNTEDINVLKSDVENLKEGIDIQIPELENYATKEFVNELADTYLEQGEKYIDDEIDSVKNEIDNIKISVGDSESGLIKDVADLKTAVENIEAPVKDVTVDGNSVLNEEGIAVITFPSLEPYATKDEVKEVSDNLTEVEGRVASAETDIVNINNKIGELPEETVISDTLEEIKSSIETNKNIIDEYTINNKKISENPTLDTDNIKISENYSTLNDVTEDSKLNLISPDDVITNAISKLEIMLANTTLALTAALNDIESKLTDLENKVNNIENNTIN